MLSTSFLYERLYTMKRSKRKVRRLLNILAPEYIEEKLNVEEVLNMPEVTNENECLLKIKVRNDLYNAFAEFINTAAYRNDIKLTIMNLLVLHALNNRKIMKNITSTTIPKTSAKNVKYIEMYAHIPGTKEELAAILNKAGVDYSVKANITNAGLEFSNQIFTYYMGNGGKRIIQKYIRDNEFQKDLASFFKSAKIIKRIIHTYKKDEEFLDNVKEIFGEDIEWLNKFDIDELDAK